MATTFLEPGGDATFNVATTTAGGFWGVKTNLPDIATDFVHGSHINSIKYRPGFADVIRTPTGTISDAGSRISYYIYLNVLPSATAIITGILSGGGGVFLLKITSAGVLQFFGVGSQMGTDGATLATGRWYRLSIAYTITSSVTNEFRLFVDGSSSISVSNFSLDNLTGSDNFRLGNANTNATLDFRTSDHYADDSSSLTDTGDIFVTAKRPNANGTANNFSTQIGAGGSGYGTGHSPQVNERPLSTTNGWSMVGAGSAVTEEYNIEGKSTGDIDISGATIIDYSGWAYISALVGETIQMIVNGVNFAQAITSTNTMYTKVAGSTTYPAGTGADIGITTDTSLTTVSLFEAGIMVAYIPPPPQWNVVIS